MCASAFILIVQVDSTNWTAWLALVFASIEPQLLWAIKHLMDLDDSVLLLQLSVLRFDFPVESNSQSIALTEADLVIVYPLPKRFVLDCRDHRRAFVEKAPGALFCERELGND
jgi:hypothetical protein